ncbi:MAG: ATP-binding cassette domain-containing protein [Tannerellaceae bacterium]|jgi:ABC-type multidrug transport system ATPase subunit|nr:ATP-binding cassette domain-containing protein [Tannerellaceae bacterium]
MKAIQATNVSHTSNSILILDDISIISESRKITALLGHNGSGKSTFIDILCGIIKPQKGEINLFNSSFSKEKKEIGVLWDNPVLFPMLKVKEIIRFCMKIYNLNKLSEEYYHILELGKIKDRFYYQLSKGEKKEWLFI